MSDEPQMINRRIQGVERHASTVGIAVIIALLMWVGNSILEQGISQGAMSGDIRVLSGEVAHLKQIVEDATKNRYTARDAERDKAYLDIKINGLEGRVKHLEEFKRRIGRHGSETQ